MKFISLVDFEHENTPIERAAVRVAAAPESVGGPVERFVPRRRTQDAVLTHERLGEPEWLGDAVPSGR